MIDNLTSFESEYVRKAFDKENKDVQIKKNFRYVKREFNKMKNEGVPIFIENLIKKQENDENQLLNGARAEIAKLIKKKIFLLNTLIFKKRRIQKFGKNL